jgi:hypothetical protein
MTTEFFAARGKLYLNLSRMIEVYEMDFGPNGVATKAVALALASQIRQHTDECWPKRATLTAMTGLGDRALRQQMQKLEEMGLFKREAHFENGRQDANRYQFHPEAPAHDAGGRGNNMQGTSLEYDAGAIRRRSNQGDNKKETPVASLPLFPAEASKTNFSPALESAWQEFVAHRKEMKKPVTERAAKLLLKTVRSMSEADAIDAIEKSIASRWSGIFPPKAGTKSNGYTKPARKSITERPVSDFL